jgi:hypothetical protein
MTTVLFEQRNPYKGTPPRPWARLRLAAPDGFTRELELVADTGNPCALIIGLADMTVLQFKAGPSRPTNFGMLQGGWLHLSMSELGLNQQILGYASDVVLAAAQSRSPDFAGLLGLPLLRLLEYGGDADWFWLRQVSTP